MAGQVSLGETGQTVRANVKWWRDKRNLTLAELARRTEGAGRPIPVLGVRRIEAGERRVDADDLMALAVAFGVSPITLLMPPTDQPEEFVSISGAAEPLHADRLWDWLCAQEPLPGTRTNWAEFRAAAWPSWLWEQFAAADELQARKQRFNEERDRLVRRAKAKDGDD